MKQNQFLEVVTRDEAVARFTRELGPLRSPATAVVSLDDAMGRVLANDIRSAIDVTGFDRSMMDGFAVRAADTSNAAEHQPRVLNRVGDTLGPGVAPECMLDAGECMAIATGAMIPRGADAVLMVEHTDVGSHDRQILATHSVAAGANISFAGSDIAKGQLILAAGTRITSREIGVAAAIGLTEVAVLQRPSVAIISTGNEVVAPGEHLPVASVYDSNAAILAAAVREAGGEPVRLGIIPDDVDKLRSALAAALQHDVVILSGGTSKGEGDLCSRVVREMCDPGVIVHGVALKPGKPVCLALHKAKPVFVLPGFPTSAVFTFHEFVGPVIRRMAGWSGSRPKSVQATLPVRWNSQRGRVEYALVSLIESDAGLVAWPMGAGSGSVTTFSLADGFIRIDQQTEFVEAGSPITVTLLSEQLQPADLVFAGSHCSRVEELLTQLRSQGFHCKALFVGSHGGLRAVHAKQCDVAGMHLLDSESATFNRPFLKAGVDFIRGYPRMQGLVCRKDDRRFDNLDLTTGIDAILQLPDCRMINRNSGSGTRVLIDNLLQGKKPPGYSVQPASHNAVCAAVTQGRADWGISIEAVADQYPLRFFPLAEEQYDFAIPAGRADKPAVAAFLKLLNRESASQTLPLENE